LHGERAEQYGEDQRGEDTDMAGLDPWRWAQQRLDTLGSLAAGGRGHRGRRGWVGALQGDLGDGGGDSPPVGGRGSVLVGVPFVGVWVRRRGWARYRVDSG